MSCEAERARVVDLEQQHKDAQDGCHAGLHGECARAATILRQLAVARGNLERCLHPPAPLPPPLTTDVRLDQGDGTFIEIEARVVKAIASDFMLDLPARRLGGGGPNRRALVHDQGDGLTINFNGDYPGGVTVGGKLFLAGVDVGAAIDKLQSAFGAINRTEERLGMLEHTIETLVTLVGASIIPPWQNKEEVENGGLSATSAADLGLVIDFQFDRLVPGFGHEDVIRIEPRAGSAVLRGSTVVVTLNLLG